MGLNMGKPSSVGLFLFILYFLGTMTTCWGAENLTLGCFQVERKALIKFKDSLVDSFHQLSSWVGKDCCAWYGLRCDETTGHVIKLDLRNDNTEILVRSSGNMSGQHLVGRAINSSLLNLKYLEYLDLSGNDFLGSPIPKFLGSMKQLRYLNLSGAGLSGPIPHQLGNLSSLRVLGLSQGEMLTVDDLAWVSRLSSLQRLDMSHLDLSQVSSLMNTLSMIPSLLELCLSRCRLDNTHLSHGYINSTLAKIQHLDLSANSFEGKLPNFLLRNLTSLKVLDLSENNFNSSLPRFMHESYNSLVQLNLAMNRFSHIEGGLSMILWSTCHLKSLDLSWNGLQEEILGHKGGNFSARCDAYDLETLNLNGNKLGGNLTDFFQGQLKHLKHLDLSFNSFSGTIPVSLGKLFALEELDLSGNELTGPIPASLGRLTALRRLTLADNQLNGAIPISLGQLSELVVLDISSNSLEGVVSEAHFTSLSMLKHLSAASNFMLTFKMRPGWIPPFQLENILVGSCKMGPPFPPWLQTQHNVDQLHLSNASISGALPIWLHDMNISEIDLSHNHITGRISSLPLSLKTVDLSNNLVTGPLPHNLSMPVLKSLLLSDNLLNGSIPDTLCKISSKLQVLDLSKNRFDGNVPKCWNDLQELTVLKLSSNRLTGVIPSSFGHLSSLQWLNLNNNSFHGKLPLNLRNCISLMFLDIGENGISGDIPKWIGGNLTSLRVLRLHKNMFGGRIPSELCQLWGLQILDLAGNSLTGRIPPCFVNFIGMVIQEVSSEISIAYDVQWFEQNMLQVMKGEELEYTTTLVYVVNMDLSRNKLVGEIPEELTALSGLIGLNLSHNHLTGGIPERIGSLKSLISLDFSSNNLSGAIPASLASLTSLSSLNLSHNNLSGRIPTGNQLQTLTDPSIYSGNNQLCGAPITKICPGDELSQVPTTRIHEREDDNSDDSERVLFYLDVLSGFTTGFWVVVGVLAFKKSWRRAFFQFLEVTKDRILVAISVRIAKMKRG